jgi:flavodoxin
MKAPVVFGSYLGNTAHIAPAIGQTLAVSAGVEVLKVRSVDPQRPAEATVLVVGSPTTAFRPSRAVSRLLRHIRRNGLTGVWTAAFDTRFSDSTVDAQPVLRRLAKLFGYAAEPIAEPVANKGAQQAILPQGFLVQGPEDPLQEGESERAAEWARRTTQEA